MHDSTTILVRKDLSEMSNLFDYFNRLVTNNLVKQCFESSLDKSHIIKNTTIIKIVFQIGQKIEIFRLLFATNQGKNQNSNLYITSKYYYLIKYSNLYITSKYY